MPCKFIRESDASRFFWLSRDAYKSELYTIVKISQKRYSATGINFLQPLSA